MKTYTVADELRNKGFTVNTKGDDVYVSLSSRKVSCEEVRTALWQSDIDDMTTVHRSGDKVLVLVYQR